MKQTTDEGKVMRTTRDTKAMFANELEEMMQTMPLSKVRVADLCGRCCVERRVFYYHFKGATRSRCS